MRIPSITTECQVPGYRLSPVLFGDDVINGETIERVIVLLRMAILAATASPITHQLLKCFIHESRSTWPTGGVPWISESK